MNEYYLLMFFFFTRASKFYKVPFAAHIRTVVLMKDYCIILSYRTSLFVEPLDRCWLAQQQDVCQQLTVMLFACESQSRISNYFILLWEFYCNSDKVI